MTWVIRYTDGAYEHFVGSGFPCPLEEARRFDTRESAWEHADNLCDVDTVVEVDE